MPATFTCPTCQKTVCFETREQAVYRPFCCERCKMIDLGKWFDEAYRIEIPLNPVEKRKEDLPPVD